MSLEDIDINIDENCRDKIPDGIRLYNPITQEQLVIYFQGVQADLALGRYYLVYGEIIE